MLQGSQALAQLRSAESEAAKLAACHWYSSLPSLTFTPQTIKDSLCSGNLKVGCHHAVRIGCRHDAPHG